MALHSLRSPRAYGCAGAAVVSIATSMPFARLLVALLGFLAHVGIFEIDHVQRDVFAWIGVPVAGPQASIGRSWRDSVDIGPSRVGRIGQQGADDPSGGIDDILRGGALPHMKIMRVDAAATRQHPRCGMVRHQVARWRWRRRDWSQQGTIAGVERCPWRLEFGSCCAWRDRDCLQCIGTRDRLLWQMQRMQYQR